MTDFASPSDLLLWGGSGSGAASSDSESVSVWGRKRMRWTVDSLDFLFCKHRTFTPALLLLSVTAEVDAIKVTWPQKHFSSFLWHKRLTCLLSVLSFYIHVHVISLQPVWDQFISWLGNPVQLNVKMQLVKTSLRLRSVHKTVNLHKSAATGCAKP